MRHFAAVAQFVLVLSIIYCLCKVELQMILRKMGLEFLGERERQTQQYLEQNVYRL